MYRIAEALDALARDLGVDDPHKTTVAEIIAQNARAPPASGSPLARHVPADAVIRNVDVLTTYDTSPTRKHRQFTSAGRTAALEPSYSGFLLLLGTDRTFPDLPHHSIFFAPDYARGFGDIVDRRATDRANDLCLPRDGDGPSAAPQGCDNLFVMVNVPWLDGKTDWPPGTTYRDHVLDTLARRGLDLADAIVWNTSGHRNIARRYGAQQRRDLRLRLELPACGIFPSAEPRKAIRDLYFAGGSSHPGGGVPLALLSGKIAADLILEDTQEHAA